jgi:hypothetical protein
MALLSGSFLMAIGGGGEAAAGEAKRGYPEPFVLSKTGSTRATAYFMSNKIITTPDKVHVAWLDENDVAVARTLDRKSGKWSKTVRLGQGADNHGGPAMVIDGKGYLHVVFGPHDEVKKMRELRYRRSVRPNDTSEWTPVVTFGDTATYPSMVCDRNDTLHLAYRGAGASWPRKLIYHRRPADGEWSAPRVLAETAHPPKTHWREWIYTHYGNSLFIDSKGRIHLVFHFMIGDAKLHQSYFGPDGLVGYMRSADGGDTWLTSAGKRLETPVTPKTAELIVTKGAWSVRASNVVTDADDNPYFAVEVADGERMGEAALWHHDGNEWRSRPLNPLLEDVQENPAVAWFGTTLTFDKSGRFYIAQSVAERSKVGRSWGENMIYGHPTSEVVLLVSDDSGKTFTLVPISKPDPARPYWHPSLERPIGRNAVEFPHLIYTHGFNGPTEVLYLDLADCPGVPPRPKK